MNFSAADSPSPSRDPVPAAFMRRRIEQACATATAALLRERHERGWWCGELSSSALSTATAVAALAMVARATQEPPGRLGTLLQRGGDWLIRHQNADGGWGDTPHSISNLSTTALVWAAVGMLRDDCAGVADCLAAAERWLTRAAGSLEPRHLVPAIERRYGQDRTFSIPILTMCALCGRLGPPPGAWRYVRQLPFEVAVLPQRWFAALKLPVVSYALPALIAIGQVRHILQPSRNPLLRFVRDRCRRRTLDKLTRLQPPNGGFLEAAPLTSFVTMSLAAIGLGDHVVAQRGVAFLAASVRPDGSWPIDTNLATWVTTLAVNAVSPESDGSGPREPGASVDAADPGSGLPSGDRHVIRSWLVGQQFSKIHPYTLAAPGGWAWTDLPGGVPDADDTAGALLALYKLGPADAAVHRAVQAGVRWLVELQNRDGGIPTFCRGWGKQPFDRSSPDLTAHAIRAWLAWQPALPMPLQQHVARALKRAATYLRDKQRPDGAWIPLWFGNQHAAGDENPVYGTARVVPAFCALEAAGEEAIGGTLNRALEWLVSQQNNDGGWSGAAGTVASVEETGVALEALAAAWDRRDRLDGAALLALQSAIERGGAWLAEAIENDRWRKASPIGLYFAKLWYHEKLYPLIFATAALQRLVRLH
jgi:squalene-hopene/tetraprenyl-beta-curcumene cyclase